MKLENQLQKIETTLLAAVETRNINPPVRQALRDALDAVVRAQREMNDTMYPYAMSYTEGRLYKADESGKFHALPTP
jgi:spore coat protein CotF